MLVLFLHSAYSSNLRCFYITKYHENEFVYAEVVVYPGLGS